MDSFGCSKYQMRLFKSGLMVTVVAGLLATVSIEVPSVEAENLKEPVNVQNEDSLEKVAESYGSTTAMWKKANFLDDHYLTISQTLNIVFPYQVKAGDKLAHLAKKYNTTEFAIKNLNHIEEEMVKPGRVLSIPVNSNQLSKQRNQLTVNYLHRQAVKKAEVRKEKQQKLAKRRDRAREKSTSTSVNLAGKSSLQLRATAYNVAGNEKWGKLTAMGTTVRHGVVAVDPDVIPLGTKLYVSGYNSPLLPKGGFVAVAEDTGGAIKGNRIDIFIDAPHGQVSDFGVQNVKVTILK